MQGVSLSHARRVSRGTYRFQRLTLFRERRTVGTPVPTRIICCRTVADSPIGVDSCRPRRGAPKYRPLTRFAGALPEGEPWQAFPLGGGGGEADGEGLFLANIIHFVAITGGETPPRRRRRQRS